METKYQKMFDDFVSELLDDIVIRGRKGQSQQVHPHLHVPTYQSQEYIQWKANIWEKVVDKYLKKKKTLQQFYEEKARNSGQNQKKSLFDRHKISALFSISIMECHPFKLRTSGRMRVNWYTGLANPLFAFYVGIYISCFYDNQEIVQIDLNTLKTILPETNYNDYEENFCIMLQSMANSNEIFGTNILKLSMIYYHIHHWINWIKSHQN